MRVTWVVPVVLFSGAMLLPVAESKAVPLDGIKLVAEVRPPASELAVAGKNATKNGSNGNKNGNGGNRGDFAVTIGAFFSFAVRTEQPASGDLVAVELR